MESSSTLDRLSRRKKENGFLSCHVFRVWFVAPHLRLMMTIIIGAFFCHLVILTARAEEPL
jgi:hypothetical protein